MKGNDNIGRNRLKRMGAAHLFKLTLVFLSKLTFCFVRLCFGFCEEIITQLVSLWIFGFSNKLRGFSLISKV